MTSAHYFQSAQDGIVNVKRNALYTTDVVGSGLNPRSRVPGGHSTTRKQVYFSPVDWAAQKLKMLQFFPTFRKYSLKDNLLMDFNAALILTALVIPQCMAYAMLAKMPPIIGIYISIIQPLLYSVLGTCPFTSFGTFALLSMLVGDSIDEMCSGSTTCTEQDRISLGASLSLAMGLIQMLMMLLKFGKVTQLLDNTVVRAFTTAIAFHIAASQIKNICFGAGGISPSHAVSSSDYPVLGKVYEAVLNVGKFNPAEFALFAASLTLLLPSKAIAQFLKSKWKHIEVPMDFIVVSIAACLNYYFNLGDKYAISSVGKIQFEMASFLPNFTLTFKVFHSALVLSLVAISMHLSFIKVFNSKLKQQNRRDKIAGVDQEILAAGVTNFVSSWFSCYPGTASLSRSVVLFENEAKSQLTGIISSSFMVIAYLLLKSALAYIPMAVLAAIIVNALRNLFKQFRDIPELYKTSKIELMVWITTFLVSFIFSCEIGLLVGFCASVCRHLYLENQTKIIVLHSPESAVDLLVELEPFDYERTKEHVQNRLSLNPYQDVSASPIAPFCALRVTGPINSITADQVVSAVTSFVSIYFASKSADSVDSCKRRWPFCRTAQQSEDNFDVLSDDRDQLISNEGSGIPHTTDSTRSPDVQFSGTQNTPKPSDLFHLLLDLNHVSHLDHQGLKRFQDMFNEFPTDNVILICDRADINFQLVESSANQNCPLNIVPTFVDALACMPRKWILPHPDVIRNDSYNQLMEQKF